MIDISPEAQAYFKKLIEQQGDDGLGLRLRVLQAGTPAADCDLQFCPQGAEKEGDQLQRFEAFNLHVDPASREWLEEASIDFEEGPAGGQLTIKAPNIKGESPSSDAGLGERVAWVLETEINPRLAAHGGRVALQEITEEQDVVLSFGGGCHGCGMADVTLKEGIEKTLRGHFPDIGRILDATDHDTGENPYFQREE